MAIKVFLSHNSSDKPAVEVMASRLSKEADIVPWLDAWNLIPGQPWQDELEEAIKGCDSCVFLIGRGDSQTGGIGPWQHAELCALLNRQISERGSQFAVIPVLLPGADRSQRSALPTFLVANTWVEFRRTLDEPDAWKRLLAGIRRMQPGPPATGQPAPGECPYRGLEFFDVPHADRFFGRESVTQWLVDDIRKPLRPGSDLPRFLALLGASGSGKSSLARAGLYADLKRGVLDGSQDWLYLSPVRPGPNPLENLELAVLGAAAGSPQLEAVRHELRGLKDHPVALHRAARLLIPDASPPRRLFLLVDQFEEVFTTCQSEDLRRPFIAALLHAARERGGPVVVAITMRADFSAKVASYDDLARVFDQHQFLVGPMSEAELRLAIEEPARRAGAEFDPGLVDTLVRDVHRQPGALALLQYALLELWNRREDGRRLTHSAYEAIGKLHAALERRANEVFAQFGAEDQELCRRVFLRLVHPGEGAEDTRRRVDFRELLALGDRSRIETLIATLAAPNARLVVTKGSDPSTQGAFVEVAHETLIQSWSQLRRWLDADRAGLRTQRRLTEAAHEWEEGGRKPDFLYTGGRLAVARDWLDRTSDKPNAVETEFLEASIRGQRDTQAEALRKEQARADAARRNFRIAAGLGFFAFVCAVAAGLFFGRASQREADANREKARALDLVRFMDAQVGQAFVDAVPVQLRERVSARVDAFYSEQGGLADFEDHERMGYHLRKAEVHLAAIKRYAEAGLTQAEKEVYFAWERNKASTALNEVLRIGDTLVGTAPDDRGVTRDRIHAHLLLAILSRQLRDATAAAKHQHAARALLARATQGGPFKELHYVDWMGLPNLNASEGDLAAEVGDKLGAHQWYEKALALQAQLVDRRPWDESRKAELRRIEQRVKETAP